MGSNESGPRESALHKRLLNDRYLKALAPAPKGKRVGGDGSAASGRTPIRHQPRRAVGGADCHGSARERQRIARTGHRRNPSQRTARITRSCRAGARVACLTSGTGTGRRMGRPACAHHLTRTALPGTGRPLTRRATFTGARVCRPNPSATIRLAAEGFKREEFIRGQWLS